MRRFILLLLFACVFGSLVAAPSVATACPNCKTAIESDPNNKQPKAYMYSILFMLSMPAILFGSFGYGLYRLSKKNAALQSLAPLEDEQSPA